ncbi:MAG: methyltransferase domain-containing protein [Bacteroidota bacterium]
MKLQDFIESIFIEPLLKFVNKFITISKTSASKKKWKEVSQKGEFNFHKSSEWRNTSDFMDKTIKLFKSFGFNHEDYKGKTVLDLGAGSKLRSKFFHGARLIVIEPMADDCIREIPWCDLNDAEKVYSTPAEEYIEKLEEKVDFVVSINVLDHCYNFKDIVGNIHKYLKKGGLAFLSFDAHFVTNKMHPLILTDKICTKIFEEIGFEIQRKSKGFTTEIRQLNEKDTYGHGSYCLNYWLIK